MDDDTRAGCDTRSLGGCGLAATVVLLTVGVLLLLLIASAIGGNLGLEDRATDTTSAKRGRTTKESHGVPPLLY